MKHMRSDVEDLAQRFADEVSDWFERGRFTDVIERLRDVKEPVVDYLPVGFIAELIGLSYFYLGRYEEAIPQLLQAQHDISQLSPTERVVANSLLSYYALASAYYETTQYESAIDWYRAVLEEASLYCIADSCETVANSYLYFGRSYQALGRYEQAIRSFKACAGMAKKISSSTRDVLTSLAELEKAATLIAQIHFGEALVVLNSIDESHFNREYLARYRALKMTALVRISRYEEALRVFSDSLEKLEGTEWEAYSLNLHGVALFNLNRLMDARESFIRSNNLIDRSCELLHSNTKYLKVISGAGQVE